MALVDLRNSTNVFQKGSSLLAVGLTAAQGALAFPAGHLAVGGGWIQIGNLEGGNIGISRDIEEIKDEADALVTTLVSRNELVISNTMFQTDSAVLNFFTWLEDNSVPGRYPLPTPALTATPFQWWLFPVVTNRKIDWQLPTGNAIRTRPFELLVSENGTDPLFSVIELPTLQTDPLWTPYSAFIDSALP